MTSPLGLAELILPARGAAQKATASFAEQLTDSPGRSDVESPTSSNPFREPTHRTKSVKYRYSAIGKHLSSPLKGSSSSPERKPGRSRQEKPPAFTPAPSSHAAKAFTVSTTLRKRKASPSSFREEDVLKSTFTSSSSPLSSVPTTPSVPTKDLPLSPTFTVRESISNPPKRRSISKALSLRSLHPTTSKFSVFSQPLSPERKQKKNRTNAEKGLDIWDIGNSVWIRVNQSGVLADSHDDLELSESPMWWPAQVVQKKPLRVSMFGDFPSSSSTSRGLCTIFAPSSSHIQSIHDERGAKRFSRSTFRLTSVSANSNVNLPNKKPRLDESASIETKWESAVQRMEKASTLEKDGLPALLSSYSTTESHFYDSLDDSDPDVSDLRQSLLEPTSSAPKKAKAKESTRKSKPQRSKTSLNDDVNISARHDWSPCLPDPTLQIPGELIFALAPKTGGVYWPTQILEHVPGRKEKYRVRFLDDEEHVITRDKFWTSEEEGFVRCTLGDWESEVKTVDDPDSGDEGGEYNVEDDASAGDFTSALPLPPPAEDFKDLPIRTQLAYVKPVLRAILNDEYAPARKKHEAFLRGGSGRAALLKSAGVRGGMDARFVKAVQKGICKWVLGDSGVKPERLDTEGITTTGTSGAEEAGGPGAGATVGVISPEVMPAKTLPRDSMEDDGMEGIEGATVPEDVGTDKSNNTENGTIPLTTLVEVARDSEMVVDVQGQQTTSSPLANSAVLSPAVKQASLVPKSQLDLLAEVSQAVATEPSLLPSHPEAPGLKVELLDTACRDMSSQPSPLTPLLDEDQHVLLHGSAPVVSEDFEALSGVEKLDYCLNILLPEAIQQLLLWRSGERTSSALLSSEEEQRLHEVGAHKAAETDWVDDVMRLRAAQARLWGIDPTERTEAKKVGVVLGGTRSRPRRRPVSRP